MLREATFAIQSRSINKSPESPQRKEEFPQKPLKPHASAENMPRGLQVSAGSTWVCTRSNWPVKLDEYFTVTTLPCAGKRKEYRDSQGEPQFA